MLLALALARTSFDGCAAMEASADFAGLLQMVSEDATFTHMSGTHYYEKQDGEWIAVNDSNR